MSKFKKQVFRIISPDHDGYMPSKIFDISIIILILLNVVIVVADTFDNIPLGFSNIFSIIDIVSMIIFTVEYLLRLWTADLLYPDAKKPRLKYLFSASAVIDLLAILPFYIPFIIPIDLRVLRMLRLFRLIRIFKLNRYSDAFSAIGKVMKSKSHQLVSSIMIVLILMFISSVIMYGVEHEKQPDVFQNAFSGMWWAIATLTTVGYGDIYPITEIGKLLGAIIALLGIGIVAVPTGIISAGFVEQIDHMQDDSSILADIPSQIKTLNELKTDHAITEDEYQKAKSELLDKLSE